MAQWYNDDGLLVHFDQRDASSIMAGPRTAGVLRHMVVDFNYDNLPNFTTDSDNDGTNDAFSGQDPFLPAGAVITRVWLVVTTSFAGGTSYDVGLYDEDGTVIDADGLIAAAAVADMTAGDVVKGAGALVDGTSTIGGSNAYLVAAATDTFTAGAGKLYIEYLPVGVGADVTV